MAAWCTAGAILEADFLALQEEGPRGAKFTALDNGVVRL